MEINPNCYSTFPNEIKVMINVNIVKANRIEDVAALRLVSKQEKEIVDFCAREYFFTFVASHQFKDYTLSNLAILFDQTSLIRSLKEISFIGRKYKFFFNCHTHDSIKKYPMEIEGYTFNYFGGNRLLNKNPNLGSKKVLVTLPEKSSDYQLLSKYNSYHFVSYEDLNKLYIKGQCSLDKTKSIIFDYPFNLGVLSHVYPTDDFKTLTAIFQTDKKITIVTKGEQDSIFSTLIDENDVLLITSKYCVFKKKDKYLVKNIIPTADTKAIDFEDGIVLPSANFITIGDDLLYNYSEDKKAIGIYKIDENRLTLLKKLPFEGNYSQMQFSLKGSLLYAYTKQAAQPFAEAYMNVFDLEQGELIASVPMHNDFSDAENVFASHPNKLIKADCTYNGFAFEAGEYLMEIGQNSKYSLKSYNFSKLVEKYDFIKKESEKYMIKLIKKYKLSQANTDVLRSSEDLTKSGLKKLAKSLRNTNKK